MSYIVVFVLMLVAILLQNSIVNQISMLYGSADLVLLVLITWILQSDEKRFWGVGLIAGFFIGLASALPIWLPIIEYLLIVGIITYLQRRVWQVPIWLLLTSTIIGTVITYGIELLYLTFVGVGINLSDAFNLLLLPSIVLNIIFSLPIYGVLGEISKMLYPEKVEV